MTSQQDDKMIPWLAQTMKHGTAYVSRFSEQLGNQPPARRGVITTLHSTRPFFRQASQGCRLLSYNWFDNSRDAPVPINDEESPGPGAGAGARPGMRSSRAGLRGGTRPKAWHNASARLALARQLELSNAGTKPISGLC